MNELDDRGGIHLVSTRVAQGTRGEQNNEWTNAFAAARDDVLRDLGYEQHITLEACPDEFVYRPHVRPSKGRGRPRMSSI